MTEMTIAILRVQATGRAEGNFAGNTHACIERAIGNDLSSIFEVKKLSVGDFHGSLIDDIVLGSAERRPLLVIAFCAKSTVTQSLSQNGKPIQYTKLQLLDDFGGTVNDLGLAQINLRIL